MNTQTRENIQWIKIGERDLAHGILEAAGGHQAQSGTHRLGQGQTRQHRDEAPGKRGCRKREARGPWEPSGWGGTANVTDIPGGLSENQNPNSKNATLKS